MSKQTLLVNATRGLMGAGVTDTEMWIDYATGKPVQEPQANAADWEDYTTGAPAQPEPVVNAAEWTDYERPQAHATQTERFRGFTIAGLTQQLREIATGAQGEDLRRALPRLRSKVAGLLEQIDAAIANGPAPGATPAANSGGDEWIDYVKPQAG